MLLSLWRRTPTAPSTFRRDIAALRPFRENDVVLLRNKNDRTAPPILSRPLKAGKRIEGHKGVIRHDDVIGKNVRDLVPTLPKRQRDGDAGTAGCSGGRKGTEYRLHEVKLEDYVRLTKRLVTPLYPQDARLIVDLLDLHPYAVRYGEEGQDEKLEVLEAGTGHGSLTLYLARAICGANTPPPAGADECEARFVHNWKAQRKAVVHTIDVSEKYSKHAEGVVWGFRHGLYAPHVDFNVGDVGEWITSALSSPQRDGQPFLSHAFLDLPGADTKIAAVAKALRTDGTLIVFNPSITQIMDAAKKVRDEGIELELEKVVELGVNGGSGGREWDVRPVRPRSVIKAEEVAQEEVVEEGAVGWERDSGVEMGRDEEQVVADAPKVEGREKEGGWSMVCRPKVGDRIVGGGFLGVWKKQR